METEWDTERENAEESVPDDWMDLLADSPAATEEKDDEEKGEKEEKGEEEEKGKGEEEEKGEEERDDDNDYKLSLITWNVDGLDREKLPARSRGLLSYLNQYTPDVVFLQELIPPYAQFLKKRTGDYLMIQGNEEGYFTGMLLKKSRIKFVESEVVAFPTTRMMRNLLVAQVIFKGQKLCLMTSHFESCKPETAERMKQLRVVKQRMKAAPYDVTVLFGGDTNLRDYEVTKVGLPATVCDVWERLGKQEHCRYTWDTTTNNNKNVSFACRLRFDRIYFRPAIKVGVPRLVPDHMALVGLEKLDCGRFTSDHWGIYCTFSVE